MIIRSQALPPTLSRLLDQLKGKGSMARRLALIQELLGPCPYPLIKVAGTNGKGSVCAMLSAALRHDGKRVGCFTSPHLVNVGERVMVDQQALDHGTLEHLARRWQAYLPRFGEDVPTFFEFLLAIGLDYFREQAVDVAIIEAGIGGSNDSTHYLPAIASAITSIGIDHADRLGPDLADIAKDKAGICLDGETLVLAPGLSSEARQAIMAQIADRRITLNEPAPGGRIDGQTVVLTGNLRVQPPLLGSHQLGNLAVVAGLVDVLVQKGLLASRQCLEGVAKTRWPGRLERHEKPFPLILDVAHNPEALAALAHSLNELGIHPEALVYGAAEEKDLAACMELLPLLAKRIYLVSGFYRAAPLEKLRAAVPTSMEVAGCFERPCHALDVSQWKNPKQPILFTGSVFMIGELKTAPA